MVDSEKVIKDLEEYRNRKHIQEGITYFCDDPRYRRMIIDNAIAMLKEQQERIETLESLRRIEQEGR